MPLFGVALRKELFQQWRTKRVLIVVAVFAILGMLSPLLAYFTPQLISSLEETQMFADLIPEPTIADSAGQYLENVSQFGFILVIILGMAAVVGEKEKGTAAMILSKPLSRWAFVSSKLLAQSATYLAGLIVAALGAFYYTLFLFESFPAGGFLLANFLLFVWLMVYVAVTLLGSTLGKSTGAAAGLAAVGAIALLLSGALPRVGSLAPAGLVTWAGQAMLGVAAVPNLGSLVMSAVLILLFLLASVAAFEQQEL